MKKITIISGHPNHESSISNKAILEYLESNIMESQLNIRKLEDLNTHFEFNVIEEQEALLQADTIIFQFPLFWYSFPALMKKWIDDVICYGFAFGGEKGAQLKDKQFIFSFTIGGQESAYGNEKEIALTIDELLKPLKQMLRYCQVKDINYVYSHNMLYIPDMYGSVEDINVRSECHASKLLSMLN
ncbi:flavodoxin family protein [Aliivibrio fischeri]|uniref:Flavodoxin family protein n=1 Tax=Aliivibrio fischeri TaxID=668 RepID=A0A6N3YZU0_ALIFS|nr:NAD(P)H-dependent oxidoreductase [Aliivibrio fischeri]MUK44931.1 flavodoxin family protein [Aliivibrio fischeri]MUK80590.1 flavodoxin family protein [Aliivibrio fischeri]MUK84401.1 flavodoxin family protein [Aliivibrio fischeri]